MSEAADIERSWSVLLLGGPSGVGKTSVSYALARRFGVGLSEIDDLYIVAKQMTTPAQQPVLHRWDTIHVCTDGRPSGFSNCTSRYVA